MKQFLLFVVSGVLAFSGYSAEIKYTKALFSEGDDLSKAKPEYDDSSWRTIDVTWPWSDQGVENQDYGWYRFHVNLSDSLIKGKDFCDFIQFNMGKIDDADEVYLNGKLIGKTGSMPSDKNGYHSAWNKPREYVVKKSDNLINWNQDNVIAVRCYNGNDPGGMFGREGVTITVPELIDGVTITFDQDKNNNEQVNVNNRFGRAIKGVLEIEEVDNETGKILSKSSHKVSSSSKKNATVKTTESEGNTFLRAKFTEDKTGKSLIARSHPKYILTPEAPEYPRFNTAPVFGVRPGSPIHFRFGVSGERPMKFSATNLPEGVRLNPEKGILEGSVKDRGNYEFTVVATNEKGKAEQKFTLKVGDLIGLTPPMGWNSWNCWGLSVDEDKVKSSAQALIDKGLVDYGYAYINVDDAWEAPERNADGTIAVNEKFPSMKGLGDWLHNEGLKFGIYSSPGDYTCGGYIGSIDHEKQDAESYNSWGIDYLKYDWCGYSRKHDTEPDKRMTSSYIRPYIKMGEYLRQQPRDIFYSLCQYGMADVWKWGEMVDANSWRTTGDITDTWESLYDIGFNKQQGLAPYASPGHWNDPDMLVVGKVGWSNNLRDSRLTPDEQYSHITLWSLLASNMLIGCDISQIDDFTFNLLCNNEVLAVNQDTLGKQADIKVDDNGVQIWVRPLSDGTYAIGIFNIGDEDLTVDLNDYIGQLGINKNIKNKRDLWRQKDLGADETKFFIPSHGTRFLKVS